MNTPHTLKTAQHGLRASTLLALLLASGMALAQTHNHAHGAPATTETPAAATPTAPTETASNGLPWAEAEIRRIDAAAGKLSLKHGDIKNLDMPPMTMVFQLQDKALLGKLKVGDRVRFTADKVNGSYTVVDIQPLP
ncbi:MAG: copper-binding protein [Hydrogenophaga sp.]|jgi:Cu/Ag efflux protein CusF|nr:copper-binding protein [Hydrogenophaga sp.]